MLIPCEVGVVVGIHGVVVEGTIKSNMDYACNQLYRYIIRYIRTDTHISISMPVSNSRNWQGNAWLQTQVDN